jgi:flotillin
MAVHGQRKVLMFELVIGGAVALVVGLLAVFSILKSFALISRPSEILVLSGRDRRLSDGSTVGYRVVRGKLAVKWPLLENVERMDLRVFPVRIDVRGAYSKGGIPLNVHAIGNVKVSSVTGQVEEAIERFMGRGREEMVRVARETLEGNLRGVLATLTPEEVNENRLKFAEQLALDAEPDLEKLGLHIDTLKIQNVSDDAGYLDSIGRKRIAEILKVAEVAESDAAKTAEESESVARGRGEVARRTAQAQIQKAQNELRQFKAELELAAKSEEERAEAKALAARAYAEQELQQVRTELESLRLQADVVIPAEAEKVARELIAAGNAASISEQGRAMATVLKEMASVWSQAGDGAMDVFVMQRLDKIMSSVAAAAQRVKVDEVALIDGGSGATLPNYVSAYPKIVGALFNEIRSTVGIDIGGALTGRSDFAQLGATASKSSAGSEVGDARLAPESEGRQQLETQAPLARNAMIAETQLIEKANDDGND